MTMQKSLLLTALCLLVALPTAAQDRPEVRERGWQPLQVNRWLDQLARRPFVANPANDECDFVDITQRRDAILNGNRITTQIQNFGSISAPGNTITDIVWNGLGYGYEFGPFVAAEIEDTYREDNRPRNPNSVPKLDDAGNVVRVNGDTVWVMHVVSDGLVSNGGEVSPDGSTVWGWQPVPCAQSVGNFAGLQVVNPNSNKIPTTDSPDTDLDGKPDDWPDAWYNENLKEYVWPGALQQGASNSDQEALYFMNDYTNREFPYYPFPSDSTKRGLGLEVEVRLYQWNNPLAEDAIFLVYKITNKSERDLDKVIFGMWGDPHVGGPANWRDDLADFDSTQNMVFAWDADGISDVPGRVPGYFGYKFLESPGIGTEIIDGVTYPGDGIDNDNDGMIDESWTDGIDNDGDWDPDIDDVGVDGIPGTGDFGEGDGIPTAGDPFDITIPGEPDFEFTDIDESDQIGLTSFVSPGFAGTRIDNDELVWQLIQPGRFEPVPDQPGDYVFIYGAGAFPMRAGETKRFSIALIVGENRQDLTLNANTVQRIFEVGYRFAKPPVKPTLRAVPGDERVTLYWDDAAERETQDPLSRTNDFEGYVLYRSTDHEFSDQQLITDINGSKFLFKPHETVNGVEAKFDLDNGLTGPSEIPYPDRGVAYDLGDDTGLFHTFVDSNNVINGQTYYYALVAYDRGFAEDTSGIFDNGIPPAETSKTITYNPTTDSYIFDRNTVQVVPRPRAAGYETPMLSEAGVTRLRGGGTGDIRIQVIDPLAVKDNTYEVVFEQVGTDTLYSVLDTTPQSVSLTASVGRTVSLNFSNVDTTTFALTRNGTALTPGVDYVLNEAAGSVEVLSGGAVNEGDVLVATFQYFPLYRSANLNSEEANIIFDGIHLFAQNDQLQADEENSGWIDGGNEVGFKIRKATLGRGRDGRPADYEIRFVENYDPNDPPTVALGSNLPLPFEVINLTNANTKISVVVQDSNPRNGRWDPINDEPVVFIEDVNGEDLSTWQVAFQDTLDATTGEPVRGIPEGSVFYLQTEKPFLPGDRFAFTMEAASTDEDLVQAELRDIYVVPNPYVATNEIEPRNPFSRSERGDRRLYFANVPAQCTIRIYTLAGELVDTIEHNSTIDDGKAFWDLRTKDNMNIAYGLYFFHVDAPEGTFIGKFAVIK